MKSGRADNRQYVLIHAKTNVILALAKAAQD
jgi:hypothetical protein